MSESYTGIANTSLTVTHCSGTNTMLQPTWVRADARSNALAKVREKVRRSAPQKIAKKLTADLLRVGVPKMELLQRTGIAPENRFTRSEGNTIHVRVNGNTKRLAKTWLEGNGRAARSPLAVQIMGAPLGFEDNTELDLNPNWVSEDNQCEEHVTLIPWALNRSAFDRLCLWLEWGDWMVCQSIHVSPDIESEQASALSELAGHFMLNHLLHVISNELSRRASVREEELARLMAPDRIERLLQGLRQREINRHIDRPAHLQRIGTLSHDVHAAESMSRNKAMVKAERSSRPDGRR